MFIGIDPGWSGGIATRLAGPALEVYKMPQTEIDVWRLLKTFEGATAFIELVHAMPLNGSIANFKLGDNYGVVRCACRALGMDVHTVTPILWQRHMPIELPKGSGDKRTERKRIIRDYYKEKNPDIARRITLATADAIGILDYGMEVIIGGEERLEE